MANEEEPLENIKPQWKPVEKPVEHLALSVKHSPQKEDGNGEGKSFKKKMWSWLWAVSIATLWLFCWFVWLSKKKKSIVQMFI